jgi:AcrR family transcriptional regulator
MTTKQRARSAIDKQQRRAQILAAALALWDEHPFAAFAMADVAARSGLAKGTLYLYFQTKEELFLALLEQLLGDWFVELDAALAADDTPWSAERGADLICGTLEQRAALTRLLPIASSILEHNIPPEATRAYKERLLAWAITSGQLLERRLAFLSPSDGLWVLLQIHALVVGLGQMADPAPVVRQVLADPALAPLRVEFGPALRRALATLLRGMACGAGAEPGP